MAKGLDCGTSFYICATKNSITKQRNAFLTLDGDPTQVKRMLKRQNIPFVEKSGKVHIVGEHAFNYAQIFGSAELRRPMSKGLLNPQERDALPVLNAIVGELLGGDSKTGEICTYCVPSAPIDQDRRVDYHEDVLKTIIESHGYKARAIEEAVALAYEGLVDDNLTGIAISMGAGMCNIAVMYAGMPALTFAVTRGGDWVDENVSADTGVSKPKVQNIKESATLIDLSKGVQDDIYGDGTGEEQKNVLHAIRSYYGVLINYLLTNLQHQFEGADKMPNFPDKVPIVIGGGTCLVKGFIDVFNEQFDQEKFPIPVKEIRIIEDSHTSISRGCLSEAQLIEEEENETDEKSA
tara:strand:- start:176 stop:1225 length:1050 start_codon:yes stop_codon:yes gene_type:complete